MALFVTSFPFLVVLTNSFPLISCSLKVFAEADPLTKMTMEMVSHTLGSLQVQQFREEFQTIDTSHLGRISHRDFVRTFSNCDVSFYLVSVQCS